MNVRPEVESNSIGLGENETSFIPRCATPASSLPGLSPLRGSGAFGYVCAIATGAEERTNSAAMASVWRAVPISRGSGGGLSGSIVRQLVEHGVHRPDLGRLHGLDVARKHRDVHVLTGKRCREEVAHH